MQFLSMRIHCMVPLWPEIPQKSNFPHLASEHSYHKRQQDGDNVDFVYFMQNMSSFYRLKL